MRPYPRVQGVTPSGRLFLVFAQAPSPSARAVGFDTFGAVSFAANGGQLDSPGQGRRSDRRPGLRYELEFCTLKECYIRAALTVADDMRNLLHTHAR